MTERKRLALDMEKQAEAMSETINFFWTLYVEKHLCDYRRRYLYGEKEKTDIVKSKKLYILMPYRRYTMGKYKPTGINISANIYNRFLIQSIRKVYYLTIRNIDIFKLATSMYFILIQNQRILNGWEKQHVYEYTSI